ncbi:MAG: energy transducer TonB [Gemmatimonadota bacterium]
MRLSGALWILAWLAGVRPLAAQADSAGKSPLAAACQGDRRLKPDTAGITLYLEAYHRFRDSERRADHHVELLHANAIASAFERPAAVTLTQPLAWNPKAARPGGVAPTYPSLSLEAILIKDTTGRLLEVQFREATSSAELNQAFLSAVYRADSIGLYNSIPKLSAAGTDSIRVAMNGSATPPDSAIPLFRLRVAYFQIDQPATPKTQPAPETPVANKQDEVSLRYVIGSDGRAIQSTIRLVDGRYREFAEEAARVVLGSEFTPATSKGCAVPQWVHQQIRWRSPAL